MFKSLLRLLLVCFAVMNLQSCATIINGSKQSVLIKSNVQESKIYLDGQLMGQGRVQAKLTRDEDHLLEVEHEGYDKFSMLLQRSFKPGWIFGNLFLGGLIGIIVDSSTCAWYDFDQSEYIIYMEKLPNYVERLEPEEQLQVVECEQASEEKTKEKAQKTTLEVNNTSESQEEEIEGAVVIECN